MIPRNPGQRFGRRFSAVGSTWRRNGDRFDRNGDFVSLGLCGKVVEPLFLFVLVGVLVAVGAGTGAAGW